MFDFQYVILGLIQGLTEFLPISSSAHLILVSNIFDWDEPGFINDIAVHVGTLCAVIIYLYKDILNILFLSNFKINNNYGLKIIVATIPALIVGFVVYNYFILDLRNLKVIAYASIIFAIILYCVDRFSISKNNWKDITYTNAFFIGLFQTLAFIPGASRAGVTITGARLLGLKRDSAAIFSMLLSIPIILASITLTLFDTYSQNLTTINIIQTITSSIIAFITALASIHFMMKVLKKMNFTIFIVYRVLLGIIILIFIS